MKRHPEPQWFIGIRPAGWTGSRRTPALAKTTATQAWLEESKKGDAYTSPSERVQCLRACAGRLLQSGIGVHPKTACPEPSRFLVTRPILLRDIWAMQGACITAAGSQSRQSNYPAPLGNPELLQREGGNLRITARRSWFGRCDDNQKAGRIEDRSTRHTYSHSHARSRWLTHTALQGCNCTALHCTARTGEPTNVSHSLVPIDDARQTGPQGRPITGVKCMLRNRLSIPPSAAAGPSSQR